MTTRFQRILAAVLILLLANGAISARADQTNDAPPAPKTERKVFFFEGGRPIDLILAIDRHFRTRMQQILSVPSSLVRATVPKMKVAAEKPTDPLCVYNNLQDPALGQWKWEGPPADPSVLALVPDKEMTPSKKSGTHVRAFAIGALPRQTWDSVLKDVETANQLARAANDSLGGEECKGTVHIQADTKVLITAGTDNYIDMVQSVIAAHQANAEIRAEKAAEFSK